jgi:hypothetical protein
MNVRKSCWIALTGLGSLGALGQTPTLELDHFEYHPSEAITALFANGPGNAKDWIGIYPEGTVPGSVGSTIWRYVDGTGSGAFGLTGGTVLFPQGLSFAGPWTAFLLLNDGYDVLAQTTFNVVDALLPLVRRDKATHAPGEAITITFTNGPAMAKDWVAIYPEGVVPGSVSSTLWSYVDGTQTGTTGVANGSVTFGSGLATAGRYTAYLLLDDGYTVLASEPIRVVTAQNVAPSLISSSPAPGAVNGTPTARLTATVSPGSGQVLASGIQLRFNGMPVTPTVDVQTDRTVVSYVGNTLLAPGSVHVFQLVAANTIGQSFTNEIQYTVGSYTNLILPTPIYLETFDQVEEGSLPAGWVGTTYSEVQNTEPDFGDLNSLSYAGWTTVNVDRFRGTFVTYSNPENPASWGSDYQRVLRVNPWVVINSQPVTELATGRMLFGNSGYRSGASQVLWVETSDYDLTGRTDVHLGFHSLWEQNQDSIGAVEYSTDGGTNWMPVMILIDQRDIITTESGETDAEQTLFFERGDIARYFDELGMEVGGFYGAFLKSPITPALAPFIEGRVDDNPTESKRFELRRLPAADGQARVRFRLVHAGTDSWYFGVDNFGLYSIPATVVEPPTVSTALEGGNLRLAWGENAAGFVLEARSALSSGKWVPVPDVTGNSAVITPSADQRWFRLRRP